jgi:hypothetical protein
LTNEQKFPKTSKTAMLAAEKRDRFTDIIQSGSDGRGVRGGGGEEEGKGNKNPTRHGWQIQGWKQKLFLKK